MPEEFSPQNPRLILKHAIQKVDAYASSIEKLSAPLKHLRYILKSIFQKMPLEEDANELLEAIGIIKVLSPYSDTDITSIVNRFNKVISIGKEKGLVSQTLPAISLSCYKHISYLSTANQVDQMQHGIQCKPSKYEEDAFQWRIRQKFEKLSPTISVDALKLFKKSPIYATENSNHISLSQQVSPLPGEVFGASVAFKRIPYSVIESFEMYYQSIQTGFPYPAQHTGMAFSSHLLPTPLRVDLISTLNHLMQRKEMTAQALLPEGVLNPLARRLFALKKEVFEKNKSELMLLHHDLVKAFLGVDYPLPDTFEKLSHHYHHVNDVAVKIPYEALQKAWHEDTFKTLDRDAVQEFLKSKRISEDPLIHAMGEVSDEIILNEFSEKMVYSPTPFLPKTKYLLCCVIHQMVSFHKEFEEASSIPTTEIEAFILQNLKDQMKKDIEILSGRNQEYLALVEEYERYLIARSN